MQAAIAVDSPGIERRRAALEAVNSPAPPLHRMPSMQYEFITLFSII